MQLKGLLEMAQEIDYNLLAEAKDFYVHKGFEYIEVPWRVSLEAIRSTHPDISVFDLIGSGEQGFVQLMLNGELPKGKYCTITPCFRYEPVFDGIHLPYFMKLELIDIFPDSGIWEPLLAAKEFMGRYSNLNLTKPSTGVDININNIEVGSYGRREYGDLRWVYGTGLAEPRFSYALNIGK